MIQSTTNYTYLPICVCNGASKVYQIRSAFISLFNNSPSELPYTAPHIIHTIGRLLTWTSTCCRIKWVLLLIVCFIIIAHILAVLFIYLFILFNYSVFSMTQCSWNFITSSFFVEFSKLLYSFNTHKTVRPKSILITFSVSILTQAGLVGPHDIMSVPPLVGYTG